MPVCPCAYLPPRNCKTSGMGRDGGTLFPGDVRSRLCAPPRTGSGPRAAGVPFLRACRRSTAHGFAAWTSSTSSAHCQGCISTWIHARTPVNRGPRDDWKRRVARAESEKAPGVSGLPAASSRCAWVLHCTQPTGDTGPLHARRKGGGRDT
jgi:hypothetical protein